MNHLTENQMLVCHHLTSELEDHYLKMMMMMVSLMMKHQTLRMKMVEKV